MRIIKIFFLMVFVFFPSGLRAEKIILENGETLEGKIIKEDGESVWLEFSFAGGKGETKLSKKDIKRVEYAPSSGIVSKNDSAPRMLKDAFVLRNLYRKFYLEIYKDFYVEVPQGVKDEYSIGISQCRHCSRNTLSIDIQPCDYKKSSQFGDIFKKTQDPFGYNLLLRNKNQFSTVDFDVYFCIYECKVRDIFIHRYKLFPKEQKGISVDLTFTSPRAQGDSVHKRVNDMVSTAALDSKARAKKRGAQIISPGAKKNVLISLLFMTLAAIYIISRRKK